jgi:predicted nucleotide-binding protein
VTSLFLSDKQKALLLSLRPYISEGSNRKYVGILKTFGGIVKSFWGFSSDVSAILQERWKDANEDDFDQLCELGFLSIDVEERGQTTFKVNQPKIIDACDKNFQSETDLRSNLQSLPKADSGDEAENKSGNVMQNPRSVFVVHGRNERARKAMFSFLRCIGLEPLEWSEAIKLTKKGSPYIGEVLEAAFSYAAAILVLMTPDDEGRTRAAFRQKGDEVVNVPQARLNVIYEAGMAIGKSEHRTIIVELGELRPFSDIWGRHVIRIDNSPEKRNALIQRLIEAGCSVKTIGNDWMKEGDFDGAIHEAMDGKSEIGWDKVGHIWWLCSDLISAMNTVMTSQATRSDITNMLRRSHNHARALNINESTITNRLFSLKEEAIHSQESDWTQDKRHYVFDELTRIFNDIGQLAIKNTDNFKPNPD